MLRRRFNSDIEPGVVAGPRPWSCLFIMTWSVVILLLSRGVLSRGLAQEDPAKEGQESAAKTAPESESPQDNSAASEEPELPIYEMAPYDLIVLNDEGKTELRIEQLTLKDGKLPDNPKAQVSLRPLADASNVYVVAREKILEHRTFEQLVIAEAMLFVKAKNFDRAWDYFEFLQMTYPDSPRFASAWQRCLYEEAGNFQRQKKYAEALSLLHELFAINPKYRGLVNALGVATRGVAEEYFDKEDYRSIRALMRNLDAKVANHSEAINWANRLSKKAEVQLSMARDLQKQGEFRKARDAAFYALQIWPEASGVRELAEELHSQFPIIPVGVTSVLEGDLHNPLFDFAFQRQRRLTDRQMFEFLRCGPEGGEYRRTLGDAELQDLGRKLILRVRRDVATSGEGTTLSGYDVARRLVELASSEHPNYVADWGAMFGGVDVIDSGGDYFELQVQLLRGHVRPEALLQVSPLPWGTASNNLGTIGPYFVNDTQESANETVFRAHQRYFNGAKGRPQEIVETHFADSREAVKALLTGQVLVLDRVNLWEVPRLRRNSNLVVDSYAVPQVHCLVPNLRSAEEHPLAASRSFRRAINYGIDRQKILTERLLKGAKEPGCEVVSSPFPEGRGLTDPIGYANDPNLKPRPYEPYLASALFNLSLLQRQELAKKQKQEPPTALPPIVIAFPDTDMPRTACEAIQRFLAQYKITVQLQPFAPGMPVGLIGNYDFIYVEITANEPLVDARRILGTEGICGGCSPYMSLALRQLDLASDWRVARDRLREVHRIAYNDVQLIPLWQVTNFFAYHKILQGVGQSPVSLYQNIEEWSFPPLIPEVEQ